MSANAHKVRAVELFDQGRGVEMKAERSANSFMGLQSLAFRTMLSVSVAIVIGIGFPLRATAQDLALAPRSTELVLPTAEKGAVTSVSLGAAGLNRDTVNKSISVDASRASIFTIAGTGNLGFNGDGALATTAHFWFASAVAVDVEGNVFVADSFNNRIRRVDARTGVITTVAGIGYQGFSGDGGLATEASLDSPGGVALDATGNILIADTFNHRIRVVDRRTGIISTLVGSGMKGSSGDDGSVIRAQLSEPTGISVDPTGNLLIADTANHRVLLVEKVTRVIATLAGSGTPGFSGDGGIGTAAQLNGPTAVAVDGHGLVLIADTFNNRVRQLDTRTGTITTIAGTGAQGFGGDGDLANKAELTEPSGVAVDAKGNILIADTFNNRIRRIDHQSGVIMTVAGVGTRGSSGDGSMALSAELNNPVGLTQDAFGNIVVADAGNHRVLRVIPEAQ
jgi:sugar lactone lactonase YvrE